MNLKLALLHLTLLASVDHGLADHDQPNCPAHAVYPEDIVTRFRRHLSSEAVITNGIVKLGVNDKGNLNVAGEGIPSVSSTSRVGLRYLSGGSEFEATSHGCECEGWGVGASAGAPFFGDANESVGPNSGLTLVSFVFDGSTATSVTTAGGGKLQITHRFFPSSNPNLYEVEVTLENMYAGTLTDVKYRRTMDWDADPTPFSECVSIVTGGSYTASDDGFLTSRPSSPIPPTPYLINCPLGACLADCSSGNCDTGPQDHGAAFDFNFPDLSEGDKVVFSIFYGGSSNKAAAKADLASVGAEVYSLGYSAAGGCSAGAPGTPVTFTFGFDIDRVRPKIGEAMGDPHFKTWANQWYDFHGECDLVLLDAPDFSFGRGLTVHIRTTARYAYSYIETAAIKIGEDVLQISSFGQYMLNGISNVDLPTRISDYPVTYTNPNKNLHLFVVELGQGKHFTVKVFKDMVMFNFDLPGSEEEFGSTVGMLGHWTNGARLARDGVTILEDPNEFGQEWQVMNDDPKLFWTDRAPQYPAKCVMPDSAERAQSRRLQQGSVSPEKAADACAHVAEELRDMCIFDILSTDDLSLAQSGAY